jgi:hypothetical protein
MRRILIALFVLAWSVSASAQTRIVTADALRLTTVPCQLTSGAGAPSGGANCDMYLKSDGTVYVKTGGAWVQVATGTYINLQASTPGTAQTGHLNISGAGIFGGALTAGGQITAAANGTIQPASGYMVVQAPASYLYLRAAAGYSVRIADDTTADVRLAEGGGHVGIGTAAPTSFTFQVAGSAGPNETYTYDFGANAIRWNQGFFGYLSADELHVKAFIADIEQALVGGQIIAKSVAVVATAFTLPAQNATATFIVDDIANMGSTDVFVAGDFLRFRQFTRGVNSLDVADAWGTVSATAHTHNGDGTQTWTFARSADPNAGTGSGTISKGQLVIDYGVTTNSIIEATVLDSAGQSTAPYTRYSTWTTHPRTGMQTQVQIGNLNGAYDYTPNPIYGFAAGPYAVGGSFVTVDPTNGIRMISRQAGPTNVTRFQLSPDGSGSLASGAISWNASGVTTFSGDGDSVTNIDGGNIQTGSITADRFATPGGWTWADSYFKLDNGGSSAGMSPADYPFYAGNTYANRATAPFRVSVAGVMTAVGGTFKSAAGTGARVELTSDGLKQYNASNANLTTLDGSGIRIETTTSDTWDANYLYGFNTYKGGMRLYTDGASTRTLQLITSGSSGSYGNIQLVHADVDGTRDAAWLFSYDGTNHIMSFTSDFNGYLGTGAQPWARVYGLSYYSSGYSGSTGNCSAGVTGIEIRGGIVTNYACTEPQPSLAVASLRQQVADLEARLAALEATGRVR